MRQNRIPQGPDSPATLLPGTLLQQLCKDDFVMQIGTKAYLLQARKQDTAALVVVGSDDGLARRGGDPWGVGQALNPGGRSTVIDMDTIYTRCQDVQA